MKFISLAVACLVAVSAKTNLSNQLTSLKTMVQSTGKWDTNNMIDVISTRKTELESELAAGNMSKAEVADELRYLLQLVRDVETNNKSHAVTTLTARKSSLVNLEETAPAAEIEAEGQSVTQQAVTKATEELATATEAVTAAQTALDALDADSTDPTDVTNYQAAEKTLKDAKDKQALMQKALDTATTADELNKKVGGKGPMIVGIIALVVVVGGCYCYRKNSEENEGGAKEDKKLFKKVFKGKVQKKATKEEIIPTFAVPAEEQI